MVTVVASKFECKDEVSCQARMSSVVGRLSEMKDDMRGKQLTLSALEDIRQGILSGKRIELPSAQRQHLEKGNPLIGEVSFDARHRPVSTNVSRHFKSMKSIAPNVQVKLHAFLKLKAGAAKGTAAVLVIVDTDSKLWIYDFDGVALLEAFDLEHDLPVAHLVLSQSLDSHFALTADEGGKIRVHSLKIMGKKEKGGGDDEGAKKQLVASANLTSQFSLPPGASGEIRGLTAVLPIERGAQTYFVTADALGGIGVFHRNGTMKGRVRVTEDPGGVQGLLRSQGQMVLFYSSHTFGFFSTTQIDVQYPPCSGWNSPVFDVVIDPAGSSSRVVLALADGDIIVFTTSQGKSKTCDLTLKFPHVSTLPMKLHAFRGHVMALPTPAADTPRKADHPREILFFNLMAMDAGYGSGPSRALALQASFKPKQPDVLALTTASAGGTPGPGGVKSHVAVKFEGQKGLELYELSLKQPAQAKSAAGGGGGDDGWAGWLNWFPKIGVFGIALVGVVIWNVRKATTQQKATGNMEDIDEHLAKLRERRKAAKDAGGDSGGLRERPAARKPDFGDDDED